MKKLAIAGATGYLGKHLIEAACKQGIETIALARNMDKLVELKARNLQKVKVDVTKPATMAGIFSDVDTLISTVGITRQKDGLTYMDVDYQANLNLLREAQKSGVRKFIFVSVFRGGEMRHLKICEAKERFVDALKKSGLEFTVIRPTGFFSDMKDFLSMAKNGRVYLFGDGKPALNPIHGLDLANVCLEALHTHQEELEVGGPEVFTQNQIASLALKVWQKPVQILHFPAWIRRGILCFGRTFLSSKTFGPMEFFLSAMAHNMVAPTYGKHTLEEFFSEQVNHKI